MNTLLKRFLWIGLALLVWPAWADQFWDLPPAPPPADFGNLLINRQSENKSVKPATFSHWLHRRKFTCRVCHFELEFSMKQNTTEITEKGNQSGQFCGSSGCHDGKAAFGHVAPNCEKCHNGDRSYSNARFAELSRLPHAPFGNKIDWGKSLSKGLITPHKYLSIKPDAQVTFQETLLLESDWIGTPPAVFSHTPHVWQLDCSNCHPDIFNVKKKTTKHFSMVANLRGQYCGVCHTNVAFPMADCARCHPAMSN
ncbi:MAG: cytochrome c3 family protein [Rhodoferax sp.]|nr:cytochrome c3 family protein [Rhodoferax sp.]